MTLQEIGLKHGTDKATFHKFCDFYEENLPKKITRLLEIGVMDGASLKMWRDYYPDAEIIGIDIKEPQTIDGVKWLKMDATESEQIANLGIFDVIIDDGSHMTADQLKSFDLLFKDHLKEGGMYVIEDLHTSFMTTYINSEKTTYDVLKERDDVILWSRTEDNLESVTAIIKK